LRLLLLSVVVPLGVSPSGVLLLLILLGPLDCCSQCVCDGLAEPHTGLQDVWSQSGLLRLLLLGACCCCWLCAKALTG
jgi:hypothetical protein